MKYITKSEMRAALKKVAGENPKFIYTRPDWPVGERAGCSYTHEYDAEGNFVSQSFLGGVGDNVAKSVPGCIVGKVLIEEFKVPVEAFHASGNTGSYAGGLDLYSYGFQLEGDAANVADIVQRRQDAGHTWGDAVDGI